MNLSGAPINASVLEFHAGDVATSTSGKASIDLSDPNRRLPKDIAMLLGQASSSMASPIHHNKHNSLDAFLARQPRLQHKSQNADSPATNAAAAASLLFDKNSNSITDNSSTTDCTKKSFTALPFDDDDATERTATETEFSSDSLHGSSSWHSLRSPSSSWHSSPQPRTPKSRMSCLLRPPLRVAPHQFPSTPLLEDEDTEEEEQDDLDSGKVSFHNLEYHRMIGEGFFGQVWLVASPPSSRKKKRAADITEYYALKKLSKYHLLCEDQVENTIREKQLLQTQLHHPGIVRLVAAHQDTSFLYMLMDYHPGGELFDLIHSTSKSNNFELTEASAQFYTACLADALWYMHCRCNIVYRDLKPENVVLDRQGYPVLVDFGYAKPLSKDEPTYTLCGTPKYLAPEMIAGAGYSRAVDYWALGVMVYEMLTHGEHPFEFWSSMDDVSLYGSIAEAEYLELPRQISELGRNFVHALLGSKHPEQRLGHDECETSNGVLKHAWLSTSQDIPALRRRLVPAPWLPSRARQHNDKDGADIDDVDDATPTDHDDHHDHLLLTAGGDTLLTQREQKQFADF